MTNIIDFPANKVIFTPSNKLNTDILHVYNGNEVIAFRVSHDTMIQLLEWLESTEIEQYTVDGRYMDNDYRVSFIRDAKRSIKYAIMSGWQISSIEGGSSGRSSQQDYLNRNLPNVVPGNGSKW